jgi:alanine dehydrogenase
MRQEVRFTMLTLLLNKKEVQNLIDMRAVIAVVETAFKEWTEGKGDMPSKIYLKVKDGDFRAMPAALPGAAGMKWVSVHTGNRAKGLPTVMAVLIYNDPTTGYPLAIMDATEVTAFRTAATSAIASKYLARKDSQTLGIVGAGHQAYYHIIAHQQFFKLKEIRLSDISPKAAEKLIESLKNMPLKECSIEETVKADIVCTLTPAHQPVVEKKWLVPGTHINAVGADAEGKEELESSILNDALVIVDDLRQAIHAGEINVPISRGLLKKDQIYAELGEIITGRKNGRTNNRIITLFDSTGLAIEDIAVARLLYEKARKTSTGLSVSLVD